MKNNIKKYRKKNNITQEDLARHCNVSLRYIQLLENGKHTPSIILAYCISDFFKTTVYNIFPK